MTTGEVSLGDCQYRHDWINGKCNTCGAQCEHDYEETSSPTDMDGESYKCRWCGHRYRLYYEEMR